VLSFGAAAGAFAVTSFVVVVSVVTRSCEFAFSVATDDACSGNVTVAVVPVSSADTEALVAKDAGISWVAAPAACARSTTTARTAAASQTPRWFMRAAPLRARRPSEFPLTDA